MGDRTDAIYTQRVDFAALDKLDDSQRYRQKLLENTDGTGSSTVNYVRTEVGGGSPEGLHRHQVDQVYFVLAGTMKAEIDGSEFTLEPGTVVVFPAGVPHRNWNEGSEPTVHLAFCTPVVDSGTIWTDVSEPLPAG